MIIVSEIPDPGYWAFARPLADVENCFDTDFEKYCESQRGYFSACHYARNGARGLFVSRIGGGPVFGRT